MNVPWEGRTFIIAEIGKNFIQSEDERSVEEYLANAKELVRLAQEAGADAVKFQTHTVEDEQLNVHVVSPHFKGADRYSWVARNERATPVETFWKPLQAYCKELGILFFSTPMSRASAMKLEELNVPLWKIGSADILDFVCLDYIAKTKKPIIISSGMSTLEEVDAAVNFLKRRNATFALMHCVSKYPCPPEELSIATIQFLAEKYSVPIGFSDHSLSDEAPAVAVAIGAKIIEKHFSTSREHWGSDHRVSMTPDEFAHLVKRIRLVEQDASAIPKNSAEYMGVAQKILHDDEATLRPYFRKALVAAKDLPAGTILRPEHLYAMRPLIHIGGLPSRAYEQVIGTTLKSPLKRYDPVLSSVLTR